MSIWLKLIVITAILPAVALGLLWCLSTYMRKRDERSRIVPPWELTEAEIDRLLDMPDHLVMFGSTAEFNAWLRGDLPSVPRTLDLGSRTGVREL